MTRSPNPAHLNIDCTNWQNVYRVDSFGVGPVPIEAIVACVRDRRQQSSQRTKVNAAPNQAEGVSSDEDGPEPVRACAPAQDPDARRRLFPLTTVTTTRFQLAEKLAMRAPVKMLFPLLVFIFPCTFVLLLFPVAVRLLEEGLLR